MNGKYIEMLDSHLLFDKANENQIHKFVGFHRLSYSHKFHQIFEKESRISPEFALHWISGRANAQRWNGHLIHLSCLKAIHSRMDSAETFLSRTTGA
jgi:hypothetical protein